MLSSMDWWCECSVKPIPPKPTHRIVKKAVKNPITKIETACFMRGSWTASSSSSDIVKSLSSAIGEVSSSELGMAAPADRTVWRPANDMTNLDTTGSILVLVLALRALDGIDKERKRLSMKAAGDGPDILWKGFLRGLVHSHGRWNVRYAQTFSFGGKEQLSVKGLETTKRAILDATSYLIRMKIKLEQRERVS
jgi:hypothetical protein